MKTQKTKASSKGFRLLEHFPTNKPVLNSTLGGGALGFIFSAATDYADVACMCKNDTRLGWYFLTVLTGAAYGGIYKYLAGLRTPFGSLEPVESKSSDLRLTPLESKIRDMNIELGFIRDAKEWALHDSEKVIKACLPFITQEHYFQKEALVLLKDNERLREEQKKFFDKLIKIASEVIEILQDEGMEEGERCYHAGEHYRKMANWERDYITLGIREREDDISNRLAGIPRFEEGPSRPSGHRFTLW